MHGVPRLSSTRYEDLAPGQRWGPFTEVLAQDTSDRLRGEVGVPEAGRWAPPGVLPLLSLRVLRRALEGIPPGGILMRQRFSVVEPLPAAGEVTIDVRVTDQRRRPGGLATTFSFAFTREDAVCAVVDWTIRAPGDGSAPGG